MDLSALADIGNFNSSVNATPTIASSTTITLGGLRFDSAATQSYTVAGGNTSSTLNMSQATGPAYIQQQSGLAQTISVARMSRRRLTSIT